jgi:hypothetical protein
MNRALFLAILSMDSYNRGYGQGIKAAFLPGNSVGGATIDRDSSILTVGGERQDVGVGFYALSYEIKAGTVEGVTVDTTVVMYRGSDNIPLLNAILNQIPGITVQSDNDASTGFGVAFGSPYGAQAQLAMQFYNAATGRDPANGIVGDDNVIVSGHSLGGGLAGLVGSLTGAQMVLFDPMPFDAVNDNSSQVGSIAA